MEGHEHLRHLTRQALLLGEVQVFRQLLGDGAAALHKGHGLDVIDHRPAYGDDVDAVVLVEAVVLRGDDSVHIGLGQLRKGGVALLGPHLFDLLVQGGGLQGLGVHLPAQKGQGENGAEDDPQHQQHKVSYHPQDFHTGTPPCRATRLSFSMALSYQLFLANF